MLQKLSDPGPTGSRKPSAQLSNNTKPRRKLGSVFETSPLGETTTTTADETNGGVRTKTTTKVIRKQSLASDTVTPWGVTLKPVARTQRVSVTEREADDAKIKLKARDMPEFGVKLGEIGFSQVDKQPRKKTSRVQVVIDGPDRAESVERKPKKSRGKKSVVPAAEPSPVPPAKVGQKEQKTRQDSKAFNVVVLSPAVFYCL